MESIKERGCETEMKKPKCHWCGRDAVIPRRNTKGELTGFFCTWCGDDQ